MAEDHVFGENMYSDVEKAVCKERLKYGPEVVWGKFNYTDEEYQRLSIIENDINTYINEMRAKFITGDADLDADWEEYINTLNRMGLEELFTIYKSGLDAYEKAIAE
jgi:putative aldouronate transport system substrate-binding protein